MRGNDTMPIMWSTEFALNKRELLIIVRVFPHTGAGVCFVSLVWSRTCRWHRAVLCWLMRNAEVSIALQRLSYWWTREMTTSSYLEMSEEELRAILWWKIFWRGLPSSRLGVWLRALIHCFVLRWFLFLNIQLFINRGANIHLLSIAP